MVKRKKQNKDITIIFIIITIIVLIILNIYTIYKYLNSNQEATITQEILFKETKDEYKETNKYYATINYKSFKKILKSKDLTTIAIIDNSSVNYNNFITMVNKIAYYNNIKIHILELNKLSKKNEISFFEIDERFKEIEGNYIITVSNNKIISITTFEDSNINYIIEGIGE